MQLFDNQQVQALQAAGWTIIPAYAIGAAHERVRKLIQAARRCKMPEPSLEVGQQFATWCRQTNEAGTVDCWLEYKVAVRLIGKAPLLPGGWTMLARVEDIAGARMVFSMPGADDVPATSWCGEQTCDHCNKSRRRAKTFVLRNAAGEMKRVGATCMRDFLGHDVGLSYSPDLRGLDECDEESYCAPREHSVVCSALDAVTLATAAVRIDGVYISRNGNGTPTSARCALPYIQPPRNPRERAKHFADLTKYAPTPADKSRAEEALAWLAQLAPYSDFERNIQAIGTAGKVVWKSFGLACSIIAAFIRATEKQIRDAKPIENETTLVWLSGGRQHLRGQLISSKRQEAYMSGGKDAIKGLVIVMPAPGHACKVWVTIPGADECPPAGDIYEFDANIDPKECGFAIARRPTNWQKVQ
jgi:hypothetical protein